MQALVWDDEHGREVDARRTSPPSWPPRPTRPATSWSTCSRTTTTPSWRSTSPTRRSPPTTCGRALRARPPSRSQIVPVLCGSAFKNKGVQPMLDAVVDYLPSPLDLPPDQGHRARQGASVLERKADDDEPFAALAFKIMTDPYVGKLTYLRVYSGTLAKGGTVIEHDQGPQGARRAGSCRCTPTTARTSTPSSPATSWPRSGSSRPRPATPCATPTHPILLEALEFPEPVIHVAVEPKTKADQDKLSKALFALSEEDPTFRVRTDEETGQTVISGMGELHLEVLVDRMLREFSRRRQRRQAPGRLPRDHPQEGRQDRGALHPPDRRPGPVRPRGDHPRADRARAGATSSSTRSPAG